jgi:hypothetical protein
MSAVLPKVDTSSICEICKKLGRVSLSIDVRITMIRCVVYLLRIFKMFHGLMNNSVCDHQLILGDKLQWAPVISLRITRHVNLFSDRLSQNSAVTTHLPVLGAYPLYLMDSRLSCSASMTSTGGFKLPKMVGSPENVKYLDLWFQQEQIHRLGWW